MLIRISCHISLINNYLSKNYEINDKYYSTYIGTIVEAGYGPYDNYMYYNINKMELVMMYNYYLGKKESLFKKKTLHPMNFKIN